MESYKTWIRANVYTTQWWEIFSDFESKKSKSSGMMVFTGTVHLSIIDSLSPLTVLNVELPIDDAVLANTIFDETINYGHSGWSLRTALRTALNHVSIFHFIFSTHKNIFLTV